MHYHPATIEWDNSTKRRIRRLERSVRSAEETPGEAPDPGEKKALDSIETLRNKTLSDGSTVADAWCLITVFAEDENELYFAVKRIEEVLRHRLNFSVTRLPYEQTMGFLQSWAAGAPDDEFLKKYPGRLVDEDSAAALMPFTHGSLSDGRGIYVGHRVEKTDGSSCFIDLVERDPEGNKNFVVVGSSGEGKSTFLKALCDSLLLEGYLVIVFDVDGEYWDLCESFGGIWIDHTLASGKYVDPFMIPPPLDENHPDPKVARMIKKENELRLETVLNGVMRLASLLAGGLTPAESNAADRAITALWKEAEVDRDDPGTWDNCRKYSIHDWYRTLKELKYDGCRELSEKLWRFFEGAQSRMFSQAEELKIGRSNLVVYHVGSSVNSEVEEHTAAVKMSLALDSVWDAVKRNKVAGERWSAVIFDEGQRLLLNDDASNGTNTLATTIRKWNGLMVLATNKPGVLWKGAKDRGGTEGGSGLWSNSAFKVLFWLEQSDMKAVQENAELPDEVLNRLKGLHSTKSFIFRYLDKSAYDILRLELPDSELRLVKTRKLTNANTRTEAS
ncbi:MAG: AAA-like domain protein [Pelotomaculum sp. PtaB.Bin104]|nr:MAG: AAA-like domain protein [Pelotomaculum sp. PtaB.Bin104]